MQTLTVSGANCGWTLKSRWNILHLLLRISKAHAMYLLAWHNLNTEKFNNNEWLQQFQVEVLRVISSIKNQKVGALHCQGYYTPSTSQFQQHNQSTSYHFQQQSFPRPSQQPFIPITFVTLYNIHLFHFLTHHSPYQRKTMKKVQQLNTSKIFLSSLATKTVKEVLHQAQWTSYSNC